MSTQQDIYAAGSESRPPMVNKENYVTWSSRLLRYAKSRPNEKLIHNSIINGPHTNDELIEKELKQIEADDQAIQTILLGLPEHIYAVVDSCETAQEIWLRVQQMMKGSDIGIQEKKAKLFNEWERFTSNEGESNESYYQHFLNLMNDLKRNKHFLEKIASNLKFLNNLQPEWSRHVTIIHQTKDLHTADYTQLYDFLKYNKKERISSNPRNRQIGQPSMNMGQDRQMQMVGGNGENQFRQYVGQNVGNLNGYNDVQNVRNQIRCYNCRGVVHFARNYTVRPRRRDAAYLQTQLLIAQKEEAGIQLQAEEFDLMAATIDLDEIEEVSANCILMANLQQASTSSTQTDKALVYDLDGSAEYNELLEPVPEPHQVPQNDNNVISENLAIEVEKVNSVNRKLKETNADLTTELASFKNQEKCFEISLEKYEKLERCYQQSVYQEQCLSKKINALHLSFGKQIMTLNKEISDLNKQLSKEKSIVYFFLEKKKRLKSDFKTREDELLDKQIQLEKKIKELKNILVKTGQSIQTIHMLSPKPDSFYQTEQKMALGYQYPFYLKQAQKKQKSLYDGKVLVEKHDSPVVHDSEEILQLAQESREKMKQLNKEIKPANYTKINHLSG
nr:hypothetical protein [Tanacetum cinerariifolium]